MFGAGGVGVWGLFLIFGGVFGVEALFGVGRVSCSEFIFIEPIKTLLKTL